MIDVEKLKAQTDLRQIVERDLGRPRFRGRDYAAFRCPLHHEHKGYSLVVYAERWQCFGKCQAGGDAIAWVALPSAHLSGGVRTPGNGRSAPDQDAQP